MPGQIEDAPATFPVMATNGGKSTIELVRTASIDARGRIGQVIIQAIDKAIDTRWAPACERADRVLGTTTKERVAAVARTFAHELGALGAVTGGAAAVPGIGTGAAVAASLTDLGYFTVRSSELILTVGALHGHRQASVQGGCPGRC